MIPASGAHNARPTISNPSRRRRQRMLELLGSPGPLDVVAEASLGPGQPTLTVRTHGDGILHLRENLKDPAYMAVVRSLLAELSGAPPHMLDDQQIIDLAAGELVRGRLRLVETRASTELPSPVAATGPPRRVKPPPPPQESATAPRRSRPAERPQPPTGPDPIRFLDQEAQAATLEVAAESGVPFCEECARRAAQQGAA